MNKRPLTPAEEAQFQGDMQTGPAGDWMKQFYGRFGEQPDLNSPNYDYRTAWRHGVQPEPSAVDGGLPHWPSQVQPPPFAAAIPLKAPDHPTMWKQQFMTRHGVDPDTVGREDLARMLAPMAAEDLRQPNNVADLFLPKVRP